MSENPRGPDGSAGEAILSWLSRITDGSNAKGPTYPQRGPGPGGTRQIPVGPKRKPEDPVGFPGSGLEYIMSQLTNPGQNIGTAEGHAIHAREQAEEKRLAQAHNDNLARYWRPDPNWGGNSYTANGANVGWARANKDDAARGDFSGIPKKKEGARFVPDRHYRPEERYYEPVNVPPGWYTPGGGWDPRPPAPPADPVRPKPDKTKYAG